jgi:hypothetical protein
MDPFLIPARSCSGRITDTQTGPKVSEQLYRKTLAHDISELVHRGNMEDANLSQCHLLANEVDVNLDMLGATVVDGVSDHIDGANIWRYHCRSRPPWPRVPRCEVPEEAVAPSHNLRNGTVFCLSIGAGNRGLVFGGPRHQILAEEDAKAGGGAGSVGAARPVSIGVGG